MARSTHPLSDAITALLLTAGLLFSGILMAQKLTESPLYRQSQIIRSLFSGVESAGETTSWAALLTDSNRRDMLVKFAGALANAYVSFELIPVGEVETFSVIYGSAGDSIRIEEFSYHRKNLTIKGSANDEAACDAFAAALQETGYFSRINRHEYTATDDSIQFEIECIASA